MTWTSSFPEVCTPICETFLVGYQHRLEKFFLVETLIPFISLHLFLVKIHLQLQQVVWGYQFGLLHKQLPWRNNNQNFLFPWTISYFLICSLLLQIFVKGIEQRICIGILWGISYILSILPVLVIFCSWSGCFINFSCSGPFECSSIQFCQFLRGIWWWKV